MDAPDFAWQVPQPPSSNGFFPRPRSENRSSVDPRNANRPSNLLSFGTRHNVSCNSMYKKEKCRNFWFKGKCDYGGNCTFAHGTEETNKSDVMTYPEKKTCWYSWRKCPYGEKCVFLHEPLKQHGGNRDNLSRENSIISIEPIGGGNDELKYKTRLCHKWMMFNSCTRGSNCIYAHGQAELWRTTPVLDSESENEQIAPKVAVKDSLPNEDHKLTASNKHILAPKVCLFKWKNIKIKKVVNIYADWIDEESHMPCFTSEN